MSPVAALCASAERTPDEADEVPPDPELDFDEPPQPVIRSVATTPRTAVARPPTPRVCSSAPDLFLKAPSGERDPEDGVPRGLLAQLLVRRIGPDALEERAHLPGPLLQVGAHQRGLLLVRKLQRRERLGPAALHEPPLAARPQGAHPVGLAARRDEVQVAGGLERGHRGPAPLAARAAAHLEHARAGEAHAEAGDARDYAVGDVGGEPAGALVPGCHDPIFPGSARPSRKPSRQLAQRGFQPSSRLALAFEAPRSSVIEITPISPATISPSQRGTCRGGFAPRIFASPGSHTVTGAGSSSTTL